MSPANHITSCLTSPFPTGVSPFSPCSGLSGPFLRSLGGSGRFIGSSLGGCGFCARLFSSGGGGSGGETTVPLMPIVAVSETEFQK